MGEFEIYVIGRKTLARHADGRKRYALCATGPLARRRVILTTDSREELRIAMDALGIATSGEIRSYAACEGKDVFTCWGISAKGN